MTSYPVAQAAGSTSPSTVIVCRDVTAFRQGQELREAFLGLLSHELRTPVTTIYGGAAVLAKPGKTLDPQMASEILADIASESDRLYRLVEDLLVLARFDEGFELGDEPALLQHLVPRSSSRSAGDGRLVNVRGPGRARPARGQRRRDEHHPDPAQPAVERREVQRRARRS